MRLYLVQHGMAVSKEENPDRPLSDDGMAEVKRMAKFVSGGRVEVDRVWHSGKLRAQQTAEVLAKAMGAPVEQHDGLKPKDDEDDLAQELQDIQEDLLISGHLPFLSKLASLLLTGKSGKNVVQFRYAGVVCMERDENGDWHLLWIVTPDVI